MSGSISVRSIVKHAVGACKSFAEYEKRFFNFSERNGWAGWEDWLTVEVLRRLNSPNAIAFDPYPNTNLKLDIYIKDSDIAVEIKVSYISLDEIEESKKRGRRAISGRVRSDAKKFQSLPKKTTKLLLLAVVFESTDIVPIYKALTKDYVDVTYADYPCRQWFDCSCMDGSIALLAIATDY